MPACSEIALEVASGHHGANDGDNYDTNDLGNAMGTFQSSAKPKPNTT